MCPASIYQMMRGLIVVITALMSVIFLGRKQYRHHWTAIVLIVTGVFLVGYISVKSPKADDSGTTNGSEVLGIILLIISQLFAGTQFITEEKILGNYYLDPLYIVGSEGMWGLCYYIFLLPVMQNIHCGGVDAKGLGVLCNYNYLENSAFAFYQMSIDKMLILETVASTLSVACFNCFGIATTKYASAAQRSTIDTSRTLLIWIFSCLLLGETFMPLCIPGFVLLVFGTLLYNEIVVIPWLGFGDNTKIAIAQREGIKVTEADYMSASPAAAYDSKRNVRGLQAKLNN